MAEIGVEVAPSTLAVMPRLSRLSLDITVLRKKLREAPPLGGASM